MPLAAEVILPPTPASARRARRAVAEALDDRSESVVDVAELLASELVTNAVRYAGSPVTLRVECAEATVRVAVSDESDAVPELRQPPPDAVFGRGLLLVEELATAWGTEPAPGSGKTVWCEIGE